MQINLAGHLENYSPHPSKTYTVLQGVCGCVCLLESYITWERQVAGIANQVVKLHPATPIETVYACATDYIHDNNHGGTNLHTLRPKTHSQTGSGGRGRGVASGGGESCKCMGYMSNKCPCFNSQLPGNFPGMLVYTTYTTTSSASVCQRTLCGIQCTYSSTLHEMLNFRLCVNWSICVTKSLLYGTWDNQEEQFEKKSQPLL